MPKSKNTNELKKFINSFNYPNPSWDELPNGFPSCDTSSLTPHEEGLYSAIVLIWYANHGGRPALMKRFGQSVALLMAMIMSAAMIRNIISSDMFGRVVEVNAATVSGTLRTLSTNKTNGNEQDSGSILESTVSGLLKRETFE